MKKRFMELWEKSDEIEGSQRKMAGILKAYLLENYNVDKLDPEDKVAILKKDFESELPYEALIEATGADRPTCRRIRWMGEERGVVDTSGRKRKSIPPSRRQRILERDRHQCVRCGAENDLQPHHIIPVSHGGFEHEDNLATLCEDCHKKAHGGDFSTRRVVYDTKEEFWHEFARKNI